MEGKSYQMTKGRGLEKNDAILKKYEIVQKNRTSQLFKICYFICRNILEQKVTNL